jgi:hypothetical protein
MSCSLTMKGDDMNPATVLLISFAFLVYAEKNGFLGIPFSILIIIFLILYIPYLLYFIFLRHDAHCATTFKLADKLKIRKEK